VSDGGLYSISLQVTWVDRVTTGPSGAKLAQPGSGQSVFKPYNISGNFQLVRNLLGGTAMDYVMDGIQANESLGVVFDLQAGVTLADVLAALSKGRLSISIKLWWINSNPVVSS